MTYLTNPAPERERDFEIGRILRLRPTGLALRVLPLKSENRNLRMDYAARYCLSNLRFRISDLRCRTRSASPVGRSLKIRPISKFPSGAKHLAAPAAHNP